jgi:enoyl-[acyl-carrier protein] reductase II
MLKTRVNSLLGAHYAIIQGGMLWLATAELAGAVSNAGGLGVVSPLAGMEKKGDPTINLTHHIIKIKDLTRRPFGVNIPLDLPYAGALIDLTIRHGVDIVITSAGNPQRYSGRLKAAGITLLHVVSSVRQALKAVACGVDAVVAEGVEAAAHTGIDELPLLALIPQVVDAVPIPVIAAGGIVDARGVVAALALGAEGVQLGTRFVAVEENEAHLNYKRAITRAGDTDTVVMGRDTRPTRCLKTEFTETILALERAGTNEAAIRDFIGYRTNRDAQLDGDLNAGEAYCGASAGLIKDIVPVQKVFDRLVEGYASILKQLSK